MKIDCSKTEEFLPIVNRMCADGSALAMNNPDGSASFLVGGANILKEPEKAIQIAQQWSDEHPQKTYAEDFCEKFPNAKKCEGSNTPCATWCEVYNNGFRVECCGCCADCWNRPMEGNP